MRNAQLGVAVGLVLAASMIAACGGDDNGGSGGSGGTAGTGGTGGSTTASGGSGGTRSTTDSTSGGGSGGTAGTGGTGGSTTASGGSGGSTGGTGGTGGSAGSGGEGGAPVSEFDPVTEVTDVVISEVNELRGLTYASDGKIWGSGFTDVDPLDRQLAIVRFTEEGELDDTFDEDGVLIMNVAVGGDEQSRGIVELENGDIIVQVNIDDANGGELIDDTAAAVDPQARPDGRDVVLLRLDADGALIDSFGTGGMVTVDFGWTDADNTEWPVPSYDSTTEDGWSGDGFPNDDSWGIALDSSGAEERIVVFGYGPARRVTEAGAVQRFDNDRYVARVLASDGSADLDFNDGMAYTFGSPDGRSDAARRGIVEPDGSILSAGYTNFGEGFGNHVMIQRLLDDGTPDTDFGFGLAIPGMTWFNPFRDDGGMAECYALGRQSTGRIVTTGYGRATGTDMTSRYGYATTDAVDMVSFGVLDDGLDLDWGVSGTLAVQSEEAGLGDTQDRGRDMVVLDDDRVVHAGRFGPNPALFVTTPDGFLDTSVGNGGRFEYTPFVDTSHFYVIAANEKKTRIAAATSNHADGIVLAILQVGDE